MLNGSLQMLRFKNNIGDHRLGIPDDSLNRMLYQIDKKPPQPEATATSFSRWIFDLDRGIQGWKGGHRNTPLGEARRTISNVLARMTDSAVGDWNLEYFDDGSRATEVLESSVLQLEGKPLRMKPDVVYKNSVTDVIAIFEYKIPSTHVHVAPTGWPNLVGQLWTYAWADRWADRAEILLVAAIFDWSRSEPILHKEVIPRTVKTDQALNEQCALLFRRWGGTINTSRIRNRKLRSLLIEPDLQNTHRKRGPTANPEDSDRSEAD